MKTLTTLFIAVPTLAVSFIATAQEKAAPKPAAAAAEAAPNTLTDAETKAGWKLLFNGKDLTGWHNFKTTSPASPIFYATEWPNWMTGRRSNCSRCK